MNRAQGDNITFEVKFDSSIIGFSNFGDFQNVVIYMYTSTCNIAKYSMVSKAGYDSLKLSDNKLILSGEIKSRQTSLMLGAIHAEINIFYNDKKAVKRYETGINIIKSTSKYE